MSQPGEEEAAAPLAIQDHGAVRVLTLNRPQVRNALNLPLMRGLQEAVRVADAEPSVHVVVITGAGTTFCSGLDIKALREPDWDPTAWNTTVKALLESTVPVIAAVNGPANTAGLGLVLACDFAVAGRSATFTDMHAKMGLVSASGVSALLVDRIGLPRAKEMWITARTLDALTAGSWGLVNDVVDVHSLQLNVLARAQAAAEHDPAWIRQMFEAHDRGHRGTLAGHLQAEAEAAGQWTRRQR